MNTTIERVNEILRSPTASYALKDAVRQALTRDPVDALNDAQVVLSICKQWCQEIQGPTPILDALTEREPGCCRCGCDMTENDGALLADGRNVCTGCVEVWVEDEAQRA